MLNGIASFSITQHFLYNHQIVPVGLETTKVLVDYHIVIFECSCPEQQLKFIMETKTIYPELFLDTFELSTVEKCLLWIQPLLPLWKILLMIMIKIR